MDSGQALLGSCLFFGFFFSKKKEQKLKKLSENQTLFIKAISIKNMLIPHFSYFRP